MKTRIASVRITELSDRGIVDHYIGLKGLVHTGAAIQARNLGTLLRLLDITIAVARKRGIALPASLPAA